MKIVFDKPPAPLGEIERHARYLHLKTLKESKLPLMPAIDRALIQGECDKCYGPAWVSHATYRGLCDPCAADAHKPGF